MKSFGLLAAVVGLCSLSGCDLHVTVVRPNPPPPPPVVVADADVEVLQEGATYDGVVIAEPPVVEEYVFIGGHWHYWHPGFHHWVCAHYGPDWRPIHGRTVFLHNWGEHTMYGGHSGMHYGNVGPRPGLKPTYAPTKGAVVDSKKAPVMDAKKATVVDPKKTSLVDPKKAPVKPKPDDTVKDTTK